MTDPSSPSLTLQQLRKYVQHMIGCNAIRCMRCGCSVKPTNQHLIWIGGEDRLQHDEQLGDCTCGLDAVLSPLIEQEQEIERLRQELSDERMVRENLFMEPLLSREYPPLDEPQFQRDGKDLGLSVGKAMLWLVQRSKDADQLQERNATLTTALARIDTLLKSYIHALNAETDEPDFRVGDAAVIAADTLAKVGDQK